MKICSSLTFDDIHPLMIDNHKLKKMLKLLEEYNIESTIFIIPNYMGKNIEEDKEFINIINRYLDIGNEIAVHGFQHELHEFGYYFLKLPIPSLENQLNKLNKSIKILEDIFCIKIKGFRAPNYEFNSNTIDAIRRLNLNYDSSCTVFKPTHIPWHGIRIKNFIDPYPMIINGVTEIPVTGDYTFNKQLKDFDHCLGILYKDIEYIRKNKGTLVINNHIQLTTIDYDKFFKILVDDHELEFHKLIDISKRKRKK